MFPRTRSIHGCNNVTRLSVELARRGGDSAGYAVMPCCIRDGKAHGVRVLDAVFFTCDLLCAMCPAPGLYCVASTTHVEDDQVRRRRRRQRPEKSVAAAAGCGRRSITAASTAAHVAATHSAALLTLTVACAIMQRYAMMCGVLAGTYQATLVAGIDRRITNRNLCVFGS